MASDDRYAMGISRIVAGQLASEQGFEEVQQSALDILADLLNRYILEAGNRTHLLTELSHRTESTAIDVVSLTILICRPRLRLERLLRCESSQLNLINL